MQKTNPIFASKNKDQGPESFFWKQGNPDNKQLALGLKKTKILSNPCSALSQAFIFHIQETHPPADSAPETNGPVETIKSKELPGGVDGPSSSSVGLALAASSAAFAALAALASWASLYLRDSQNGDFMSRRCFFRETVKANVSKKSKSWSMKRETYITHPL